jgi:hypothetical protein
MGKGIEAARAAGAGLHADVIDDLKDQLLIAFLRRLGNKVTIPVQEVDETGRFLLSFNIENRAFNFTLTEKQ